MTTAQLTGLAVCVILACLLGCGPGPSPTVRPDIQVGSVVAVSPDGRVGVVTDRTSCFVKVMIPAPPDASPKTVTLVGGAGLLVGGDCTTNATVRLYGIVWIPVECIELEDQYTVVERDQVAIMAGLKLRGEGTD